MSKTFTQISDDPKPFTLENGKWLFRIWGAQGGILTNQDCCKGAYSEGIFIAETSVTLYYFVGSKGSCSTSKLLTTKFQGGSNAIGSKYLKSCTGGSATFISRDKEATKLLLISGAGGGMGSPSTFYGGIGGPFAGDGHGQASMIEVSKAILSRGKGATYSRPGDGGYYAGTNTYSACNATTGNFLKGGDAKSSAAGSSGGGGSGYYGGGGGADIAGGGGGSSYASPDLYNVILLGGDRPFKSPSGSIETGHTGDGYIIIEPTNPFTIDRPKVICDVSKYCYCHFNFAYYIVFTFIDKIIPLGLF